MSLRYPGGLITKSPTAPTTSAAKGIWTLEQALQYIKAGTWPLSALGDPYFQYNTLLLPGQGTNNTQNNSFLDSGTANSGVGFPINRSGETTQGTFTPFSGANGNWSNYFNGANSDAIQIANNAVFDFGTDNVTIEAWVYLASTSSIQNLIDCGPTGGTGFTSWGIDMTASGFIRINTYVSGNAQSLEATSNQLAPNQWNHIAFTRSSGTNRLFVNGALCTATGTFTQAINSGGNTVTIGRGRYSGFERPTTGFFSNVRITKGGALYTAAFTPSTTPLTTTVSAGTVSLLTCQSNRFVDNSANAFAITTAATPSVTPFQPFGAPTSAYSAATNGGSGYFDGTGDYLSSPIDAAFQFGTGDFTVESWWYPTTISSTYQSIAGVWLTSQYGWLLQVRSTDILIAVGGGSFTVVGSATIAANQWHHVAATRSGTTVRVFLNGVLLNSGTSSASATASTPLQIGRNEDGNQQYVNGYLSGTRLVKGGALYTATFTPPTSPPTTTVSSGTVSLLLNYTNAGIIDNAQDNDLVTVNDAKISTTQFKWGTSSIFFDGTGDYLDARLNPPQILNADFTVEMWVYPTTITGSNRTFLFLENGSNSAAFFMYGATGYLGLDINNVATYNLGSAAVTTNVWQHIAFTRIGTTVKAYINGNQVGTATVSAALGSSGVMRIGAGASAGAPYFGYIADMRVTKGYARYPYNFTAPTAALPLFWQAAPTPTSDPYFDYTTLLLTGNQPSGVTDTSNNVFKDSSANNFTITRNPASGPNAPTQGTFTPFSQTGWGNFFDGTSDYLTLASSADFNIFGGDMTVECWFYSTAASLGSRSEHLFAFVQDATNRESLYFNGTTLTFWTSSGAGNGPRITYANTPQNQWIHVAVAKSGSTFTMYINGVSVGTSTTTQYSTSNQSLQIGTYNSAAAGPDSFTGYISNVRVVKGTPVYTTNFIPSTTPLTAVTNTVLLTCQSNRFIDTNTQTTAKTVTPSGDTSVQAFSPFNPTASYSAATVGGSGYFDGTGDFLSLTNNAAFNFGSAAFTIEFWYYPTTLSGTQCLITNYGGSTTGFVIQMGGSTPGSGRIDAGFSGDGADITSTNAVRLNSWNHIAISGTPGATGIKLFINGAQEGSTYTGATSLDTSSTLLIGEVASTNRLSGYLCGLRLVKGGALYTATFTPPTSPPTTTVSSGTVSLLTNFTNGAIIDSTAKNDLETVGNAVISTAQSKFGGSSMFFDGTGDYLKGNAFTAGLTGSGDFTIEGWIYISSLPGAEVSICSTTETGGTGIIFGLGGGGNVNKLQLAIGNLSVANPTVVDSATFTTGAWVHFAAVRYSGTIYLFKNGVSVGTPTSASGTLDRQTVTVGAWPSGSATLTGYINDLRITKGIARYTQNFTPPTTAYLTL
jgi:hypothetical protein